MSSCQYSESNVMDFLFGLLRIKGLYMFRALLDHPQEALNKRHLVYCICMWRCSTRNASHAFYIRLTAHLELWAITITMHCLSSVYWVITLIHVSGVSAVHHQEVECMYVANGTGYTVQLTVSVPADSQLYNIITCTEYQQPWSIIIGTNQQENQLVTDLSEDGSHPTLNLE
jgi:hypothetical protein